MEGAFLCFYSYRQQQSRFLMCYESVEWTFAKQKWQRTKGKFTLDQEHKTATILPGFKEQVYA
jgi:hypothetical protein